MDWKRRYPLADKRARKWLLQLRRQTSRLAAVSVHGVLALIGADQSGKRQRSNTWQ